MHSSVQNKNLIKSSLSMPTVLKVELSPTVFEWSI